MKAKQPAFDEGRLSNHLVKGEEMDRISTIDEEILARHALAVRARARIEVRVVRNLLQCLENSGFEICEEEDGKKHSMDDMMTLLFNLDEANIVVLSGLGQVLLRHGWIKLVFGNDGYDVISDYSINLEEYIQPTLDLAEKIANGDA